MNQLHDGWDEKTFGAGANSDTDPHIVGRTPGAYTDAQNMHIGDNTGGGGAMKKMHGETLVHGADQPGGDTYRCVGSISVSGRKFEVWASTDPTQYDPLIRIDGVTVAKSPSIPYRWDKILQLRASEDCDGGIVFDARSEATPLHWPVKNMLDAYNAGTGLFFGGFDIAAYQVNPTRPINRPVFLELLDVGANAGVLPGQRHYYIVMVNAAGDRTPDGPPVGPVNVPYTENTGGVPQTPAWPQAGIAGANPVESVLRTRFGVHMRFRVNNRANYDFVEIVCKHFSGNGGPDAVASISIVHRQAIGPGENLIRYAVDTGIELEAIATDEDAIRTHYIKAANSVEYINYRVWYGGVLLGKRDIRGEYFGDGDGRLIPFTKSLGEKGHSDPVNNCYFRRFQSGERHDVGVTYWDEGGGESFVDRVAQNYQMPNRRDEKSADSLAESDAPCYAANNATPPQVTPTFEVFDIDNADGKSQSRQFINIMADGRRKASSGFSNQASTDGDISGIDNGGVFPDGQYLKSAYMKPFRPVSPNDFKFGLDYLVNDVVFGTGDINAGTSGGGSPRAYNPQVFNPTHHTMGVALRGVVAPPAGTQGFSIVASPPARRVVTQALAKWVLVNGENQGNGFPQSPATKDLYKLHVCIPDYNSGYLNQEDWEGIRDRPSEFKVQLVSPLGICTDQFGSVMTSRTEDTVVGAYSNLSDLISVARVLWDNGQVNPGGGSGGYSPASPLPGGQDHFVGAASWRNNPGTNPWQGDTDELISIASAGEVLHEAGGRSLILTMGSQVYSSPNTAGSHDFDNPATKAFHEPWYVINIIQDGVNASDLNGYQWLNHYQPWVSAIGRVNSDPNQSFEICDERLGDFYTPTVGQERYIFVRTPSGIKRYLFQTPFAGQEILIVSSIGIYGFWTTPSGVQVHGLYTVDLNGPNSTFIRITYPGDTPVGSSVEVWYNNTVPAKAYGDMITSPSMATMVDARGNSNPVDNVDQAVRGPAEVKWLLHSTSLFTNGNQLIRTNGLPIPFANYRYNNRYMVPYGVGYNLNGGDFRLSVNQLATGQIISVRQWKAVFDCEVRSPSYLAMFETEAGGRRSYPQVNYIPRPYNYNPNDGLVSNGVFDNYLNSNLYSGSPVQDWQYGGTYSRQEVLPDYFARIPNAFFRAPEFGYSEEEKQCSLLLYSERDEPMVQDSPGLKTYPINNQKFINNDRGQIQLLYATSHGTLGIVVERGVYEAMLEKSTMYSADGTEVGMFSQDKAIGEVIARSKSVGMPGSTWMSAAKGAPTINGSKVDCLMWFDGNSASRFIAGTVQDMAIGTFRDGLKKAYTNNPGAVPVCAAFNQATDELLMNLGLRVLLHGPSAWQGGVDHVYDSMLYHQDKLYGMKDLKTFVINEGDLLDGQPVRGWIEIPSSPLSSRRMEWTRVKVNSERKPTRIEFYDKTGTLVSWTDEATFGRMYLRLEDNWENFVPRANASVDPEKKRLQGTVASYRIIFAEEGDDSVVSSALQVKVIK